jgi:hypothetical protein
MAAKHGLNDFCRMIIWGRDIRRVRRQKTDFIGKVNKTL